ncbi:MAG: hypothetical protein IPK82_11435 [Polyangiaceae bacterium]|nr:hypothetical protein [Polyangiaceae bacterium]
MSVRFYNTTGVMVGVDLHSYHACVPPDPFPVFIPFHPHVVGETFRSPICDGKSKLNNITADAAPMLQKDHKFYVFPHIPIPVPPPYPTEVTQVALAIAGSKTTCVMGVASVTGAGQPLATCLAGWWGLNLDCSSPLDIPSGAVFNGNTVRTQPAISDYANAILDIALGSVLKGLELLLPAGKAKKIVKSIIKYKKKVKIVEQVFKEIMKQVGEVVPTPSDFEKKFDKKREEFVRKLLGGH